MGAPKKKFFLPWMPLERLVVDDLVRRQVQPNAVQIAQRLGVSREMVARCRKSNTVQPITGDRLACAIGFHPALVWGDLWWDLTEEESAYRRTLRVRRNSTGKVSATCI